MYRLRDCTGADDFDNVIKFAGLDIERMPQAVARCEHGVAYKDGVCRSCEGGYVDDTSAYADFRGEPAKHPLTGEYIAVEPDYDADYVIYVPRRYQARINKAFADSN